jgi:hypothetical protein
MWFTLMSIGIAIALVRPSFKLASRTFDSHHEGLKHFLLYMVYLFVGWAPLYYGLKWVILTALATPSI